MIARWSGGEAGDNMDEDILVDLADEVRRHPWWRARSRLTLALLDRHRVHAPSRVLDAGCGWGTTLEALDRRGFRASGADVSRRALEQLDRPGRDLFEFDLTRDLPPGVEPFDAVLALDVIEHLDDDRGAVARLAGLTTPGGLVIVSVPALPRFFGEFDAIQGHRRRYLPDTLRWAFEGSGLEVLQLFWWGSWLVPILRRQRGQTRSRPGDSTSATYGRYLRVPPRPARWLLDAAFRLEQAPAIAGRLRTGTSLFCVARKPGIPRTGPPRSDDATRNFNRTCAPATVASAVVIPASL